MTRLNFLAALAACALFASLAGQTPVLSEALRTGQPRAAALRQQQQQQAQAYTGRIARRAGYYVLVDTSSGTTYQLDDQHKAKRFLGKNVIVIGTLDAVNNTIHVSEIRSNKSS